MRRSRARAGVAEMVRVMETDGHDSTRIWTTWALAEMGPAAAEARPALTKALEDPVPQVRYQAERALKSMR